MPAWLAPLTVFALALAVRLVYLADLRGTPFFDLLMGDAAGYDAWAQRIAGGDWLGHEVFYQAPLYPYLLGLVYALFGRHLDLLRMIQAVMGSAACLAIAAAGARLFGRRAGLGAGLILAVYGPAVFFDGILQKGSLDILLMSGILFSLAVMIRQPFLTGTALSLGAAIGLLALTRENALILLPLVAAWMVLHPSRTLKPIVALGVGAFLVLTPVAIRNAAVGGEFHLTTSQFGSNLYIGNNQRATGTYVPLRVGHGSVADERQDAIRLAEEASGRTLTPQEVSRYWTGRAVEWATRNPIDWLRLTGKKVVLAINRAELADTEDINSYGDESRTLRLLNRVFNFGTLAPVALLGIFLTRSRWRELWILYAVAGAYLASVVVFYVFGRYRYPVVPVLVLFAGVAAAELPAWWRSAAARARWTGVAVVLLSAAVSNWPVASDESMRAASQFNVGYALETAGRRDEAIVQYEHALALRPDFGDAHSNLAALLSMRGDHAGALAHAREAVRLEPEMAEAYNNLGTELAAVGNQDEALRNFARAVGLDSRNAASQANLASALASAGRVVEAEGHFREAVRLDPANAGAHNNLGILLASKGDLGGAVVEFSAAVRLEPGNAGFGANLARAQSERR